MTVRKILQEFRRKGKIKRSPTWHTFMKRQAKSMYGMDFFTVDTLMKQRFYVYFVIHHKTRGILQFAITQNPIKEFVKQQIILFSENLKDKVYMIRDNAAQFNLDYLLYGIKAVKTSVQAPMGGLWGGKRAKRVNMNSIFERWIGSVRGEAPDHFLLFSEKQIKWILSNYISYYNMNRPHQGIDQQSPKTTMREFILASQELTTNGRTRIYSPEIWQS